MEINKLTKNINLNKFSEGLPSEVALMKKNYDNFIATINKSDFANSPHRFLVELNYLKELKNVTDKHNLLNESEKIQIDIDKIIEKLKNDFGITFKKK